MSITACATLSLIERLHLDEIDSFMARNHHLGNALTIVDHELLMGKIDQYHTYLTAIIGIDGAWRIQNCDAPLQGKTTARPHLCLVSFRQRDV